MLLKEIQLTNLLSRNQKRALISAINESLAINDDVLKSVDTVYDDFIKESSKIPFLYDVMNPRDLKFKKVIIKEEIDGKNITFVFNCYNILDKDKLEDYTLQYNLGNGESKLESHIVTITVGLLSGTPTTNIKSLLQHEIEHIYQYFRGKKLNTYDATTRENGPEAYKKAYSILLGDSDNVDKETFYVAYVIYTLSETEIDAFVNQLYHELSGRTENNIIEVLKSSHAYTYYVNSKKLLNIIRNNRNAFEAVVNSFGFDYDKFVRIFTKLNKRYILKIGKVLTRYNQENQPDEVLLNNLNEKLTKL